MNSSLVKVDRGPSLPAQLSQVFRARISMDAMHGRCSLRHLIVHALDPGVPPTFCLYNEARFPLPPAFPAHPPIVDSKLSQMFLNAIANSFTLFKKLYFVEHREE